MLKNILKIKGCKVLDKESLRKSTGGFVGFNDCAGGSLYCVYSNPYTGYDEIGMCRNGICVSLNDN